MTQTDPNRLEGQPPGEWIMMVMIIRQLQTLQRASQRWIRSAWSSSSLPNAKPNPNFGSFWLNLKSITRTVPLAQTGLDQTGLWLAADSKRSPPGHILVDVPCEGPQAR